MTTHQTSLVLAGPDAANPLGFLCAVGTLRVASLAWPDRTVRMRWTRHGVGWRPVLEIAPALADDEEGQLVSGLYLYCRHGRSVAGDGNPRTEDANDVAECFPYFVFDRNIHRIEPDRFRKLALQAASAATPSARAFADFIAAFGCEACTDDGVVEDTAFRTMSGAGHQYFLATIVKLIEKTEPDHIYEALLRPWRYSDPLKNLSMRWDPNDQRSYALQWRNPSDDPSRRKRGSVLGANRLAIEALPLFPTMPVLRASGRPALATTGFELEIAEPSLTWPVWEDPLDVRTTRSLLAHPLLRADMDDRSRGGAGSARQELRMLGVVEVFRARRLSVDYYRNFTPGRAV